MRPKLLLTIVTIGTGQAGAVTGGGYLELTNSQGAVPGDPGSKANFGFTVKYAKGGTNPQGEVNLVVRSNGRVYHVKSSAIAALAVTPASGTSPGKATLTATVTIRDITAPGKPVTVSSTATAQLAMTDNGEPGANDTLGITITSAGALWFSSNGSPTATPQKLGGGNLQVR